MKAGGIFKELYIGVEQLVACWSHNPKVAGSSPAPAITENFSFDAEVFLF